MATGLTLFFTKKKPEQIATDNTELSKAIAGFVFALLTWHLVTFFLEGVLLSKQIDFLFLIIGFFVSLATVFFGNALIFVFCRFLGGKEAFHSTLAAIFTLEAAFTGTILLLHSIFSILVKLFPGLAGITPLAFLALVAAGLYWMALSVLLVKHVQEISTFKAVLAAIIFH
ncbi:MAG: hypothetical protein QXK06_02010 [Candidatus Diapherotrites archaeon]